MKEDQGRPPVKRAQADFRRAIGTGFALRNARVGDPAIAQQRPAIGPDAGGRSPDSPGGRDLPSVGAFPYPGAQWLSLPGRKASDTETKPSLDLTYRCGGSAGLATEYAHRLPV